MPDAYDASVTMSVFEVGCSRTWWYELGFCVVAGVLENAPTSTEINHLRLRHQIIAFDVCFRYDVL